MRIILPLSGAESRADGRQLSEEQDLHESGGDKHHSSYSVLLFLCFGLCQGTLHPQIINELTGEIAIARCLSSTTRSGMRSDNYSVTQRSEYLDYKLCGAGGGGGKYST